MRAWWIAVVGLVACGSSHGAASDGATGDGMTTDGVANDAAGDASRDSGVVCTPGSDGVPRFTCGAVTCAEGEACIGGTCTPRVCASDGWCWEYPQPQGNALYGAWAASPSDAWAVGSMTTILHWDGSRWAQMPNTNGNVLHGIWGASATNVLAVGEGGTMLQWDGCAWTALTPQTGSSLYAVSGTSASNIWVVGDSVVLHFDGSSWTKTTLPSTTLLGVWVAGQNDVWVAGTRGEYGHFDGANWSIMSNSTSIDYHAVWGSSASDVWFVGTLSSIVHWDGMAYTTTTLSGAGGGTQLYAVAGTGANDVWAAGTDVFHWGGASWTRVSTELLDLRAVGLGGNEAFFAGQLGSMMHWTGSALEHVGAQLTAAEIGGVQAIDSTHVLLASTSGVIAWDGASFTVAAPGIDQWYAVWGTSLTTYWQCGPVSLQHWNGTGGDYQTNCFGPLFGFASDDMWMAGGANIGPFHWNGTGFSTPTGVPRANQFHGLATNDLWSSNGYGINHYNGTSWTSTAVGPATGGAWDGIYERSPTDVWSVGYNKTAHYNGTDWTVAAVSAPLARVTSDAAGHAWAVGGGAGNGVLLGGDGTTWTQSPLAVDSPLKDITMVGSDAWAVGTGGKLLVKRP